jgi:hypothetical protein
VIPAALDHRRFRLARALESLVDAITLLEWRYESDAESSIAKLERLHEELRVAHALLESDDRLH